MPTPIYAAGTTPGAGVGYGSVAWNGTVFCAIEVAGSSATHGATSLDGLTWTARTLPSAGWQAIAWNGTVFCIVARGPTTTCATSPDGITWTTHTMPSSDNWTAIAWNGTVFCAVGASNVLATSPDGITWTGRTRPAVSYSDIAIAANGSIFCIVDGSSQLSSTSTNNGVSWSNSALLTADGRYGITGNGTVFVTARYGTNVAETSPDGVTWTTRTLPSSQNWFQFAWDSTQALFVAICNGDTHSATSPTGTTWTAGNALPAANAWYSLAGSPAGYVAVALDFSQASASSCPAVSLLPPPAFWMNFVRTHEVP